MQKKRTKRNDKIKQSQQQQYGQGNIDNYESRYDNAPKVSNIKLIPKSEAQKRYSNIINANTVIFCTGPAGTGKTHVAIVKAARLLDEKKIKQIILCRPAVEAGEKLGFLPGTQEEKYMPWLKPIVAILVKCFGKGYTEYLFKSEKIVAEQLGYMRGLTFEDAFVILDEAQNCTPEQMKMFLSRIGDNCTMIIDGDTEQKDIKGNNGLTDAIWRLENEDQIGNMRFTDDDCVRSEMCKLILKAYRK
ncbi:MAG: PhoH family protein [Bacteroidales bacterium]|jgi:phosphate starvation-inducible PhoH-like protein